MIDLSAPAIQIPDLCLKRFDDLPPPAATAQGPDPGVFPPGDPERGDIAYWKAVASWWRAAMEFWKVDAIVARGSHKEARIEHNACVDGLAPQAP